MVRFSQQDARWANEKLGHGEKTIREWGCLVCCLAMACQAEGYSETPATINTKFKASENGFSGSLINLWKLPVIVPGMDYIYRYECLDVPAPIAQINSFLQNGHVVVVRVDYDPDKAGIQDHWVVLDASASSTSSLTDQDYLILDPWPLNENTGAVSLLRRFGKGKTAEEAIYDVCVFGSDGSTPVPNSSAGQASSPTESPSIPLQEGGQSSDLPAVGTKLRVLTKVNERLGPSRSAPDVGDVLAGEEFIVAGEVVTAGGINWVPVVRIHYVAMGDKGVPFLEVVKPG